MAKYIVLVLLVSRFLNAQVNVLTWHNDNARTGQNLEERILTPANVKSASFGRLFTIAVDGKVDAQPLYVSSLLVAGAFHNVLYVATEHASVYAFDADTGAQLWHVSLLGSDETTSDDRSCGQIVPEIGVTSTPVIDLAMGPHGTLYTVAMSKSNESAAYMQRLHALDLSTGAEEFGGPVEIAATYPGTGAEGHGGMQIFNPAQHEDRPALLIVNGVVYTSWGSHCDIAPYTGWVIGYSESTLAQTSVLNLTPNGSDGGIWMAGAGPAADASGNIYLLMGNGTFDTTLASGFPSKGDYGNAFVKIQVAPDGTMSVADYFTMLNTTNESNSDTDLGSGGAMVIPSYGIAVGAGKDRNIYVVSQSNMGKYSSSTDAIYQFMSSPLSGAVFSSPAWYDETLYYGATGDALRAFPFSNGSFSMTASSRSAHTFGSPGSTPSISAEGRKNAILWAAENSTPAVLHAYDASNLATELYNSNQAANGRDQFGNGNKFIVPTIANGKVYVGTQNSVGVFGLLCSVSIAPDHAEIPAGGGSGSFSVTPTNSCSWSATTSAAWIMLTPSGETVGYAVAPNTGPERHGMIFAGGKTFEIVQRGMGSRPGK